MQPMTSADETIFVVDDDDSVRKSLTRLIRAAGWRVESFSTGSEFLVRLPYPGRGCVILDITMPDIPGMELRDRIAAQNPSLPVIFLTGNEKAVAGIRPGVVPGGDTVVILTKPADAGTLISGVRGALERQAAGDESKSK